MRSRLQSLPPELLAIIILKVTEETYEVAPQTTIVLHDPRELYSLMRVSKYFWKKISFDTQYWSTLFICEDDLLTDENAIHELVWSLSRSGGRKLDIIVQLRGERNSTHGEHILSMILRYIDRWRFLLIEADYADLRHACNLISQPIEPQNPQEASIPLVAPYLEYLVLQSLDAPNCDNSLFPLIMTAPNLHTVQAPYMLIDEQTPEPPNLPTLNFPKIRALDLYGCLRSYAHPRSSRQTLSKFEYFIGNLSSQLVVLAFSENVFKVPGDESPTMELPSLQQLHFNRCPSNTISHLLCKFVVPELSVLEVQTSDGTLMESLSPTINQNYLSYSNLDTLLLSHVGKSSMENRRWTVLKSCEIWNEFSPVSPPSPEFQ
jgi:hypothetical protein